MGKGDLTKTAILERAIALAGERGLEGLTIGRLADETGMSKSGLFAHFGSKEALAIAVLEAASQRFVESVVVPAIRAPRGEPRVRALFERWLDWLDAGTGGCPFIPAAAELDDKPGPARDRLVSLQAELLETISTAVRIAIREKHFREDLEPEQFGFEMVGVLLAYTRYARLFRDPRARERAARAFEALLERARPSAS